MASIDPALGGSVEAPRLLTLGLLKQGHAVEVVTLTEPKAGWAEHWGATVHFAGPASGYYLYSKNLIPWLRANASRFDVLVVHGVWRYMSIGVWRALRNIPVPYVLYPHGMLDPFYNRFPWKRFKKLAMWRVLEHKVVRDAAKVIFTCEQERLLSSANFVPFACDSTVLSLGIETPPPLPASASWPAHLERRRVLLFLARIDPQKGCDTLISAFARVAPKYPNIHLLIAGPDLIGWKRELIKLAESSGASRQITWHEPVFGDTKWEFFHKADAYILPTNFENFGISIVEALSCGLPVLISDKAAIWREIEAAHGGFVSQNTVEGTAAIIEQWASSPESEHNQLKSNALQCFREHFEIEGVARKLSKLLVSVVDDSNR